MILLHPITDLYLLDPEMASTSGAKIQTTDKIFLMRYSINQITGCNLPSNDYVLCVYFMI